MTSTLTADEKEILELFDEAARLKEIARKSADSIDSYLQAAPLLKRASLLSMQEAEKKETEPDDRLQHLVFGYYYSYEEQYCLGGYYYEKHDTARAIKHIKLAAEELSRGVALIKDSPPSLADKTKKHLASFLPNWQHFLRHLDMKILANQARAAWDSARFIEALDIYRKMASQEREFIGSIEFKEVAAQYQRIAVGNYIGTMVNVSSAMAAAILERTKVAGEDGVSEIPFDLLIKLVEYTLDAYRLGHQAFDQNPEWDQYRAVANQCSRNIQNFLKDNPSARVHLSIAFEDDPDFVKILRLTEAVSEGQVRKVEKAKILFLSANPAGAPTLRLDEEMRSITQKVRAAEYRDRFDFVIAGAARPDDFLQAMNEHRPRVVHFSGHGTNTDEIIVCDDSGNPKPVSKDALVALFESSPSDVQVVLLNSCHSRSQAEAIVSIVPCAIGMKDTISDEAASVFAASFYRAIAFGFSVKHAFMQGIAALKLEGLAEDNVPELITGTGIDPAAIFVVDAR
jgi:tetratricopeptide (TPR) repeat protein